MKADIIIPKVENVHVAIVNEYNAIYKTQDWNAYIINDKQVDLEMVLILSKGFTETKMTSTMRHKLEKLPAKSYAKIEMIQEAVLSMNNVFNVSFFDDNKLFEK